MAEKKAPDSSEQQAQPPAAGGPSALWTTPIIMERTKGGRKKRKKKYSRGTKGFQRLILGFASAASRVTSGASRGAKTWVRRTRKSQRKRRDGLVRDALTNLSRGFGKGANDISKAPDEITKRLNTGRGWRMVRVFSPF